MTHCFVATNSKDHYQENDHDQPLRKQRCVFLYVRFVSVSILPYDSEDFNSILFDLDWNLRRSLFDFYLIFIFSSFLMNSTFVNHLVKKIFISDPLLDKN